MYSLPPDDHMHPLRYWQRCVQYPEHLHLKEGEPRVGFLLREFPKVEAGRQVLGSIHLPDVQGKLKDVFIWMLADLFGDEFDGELPDFLVVLDAAYWREVDDHLREILMFHEMSHAIHKKDSFGAFRYDKEGRPIWGLRGHDVEEFTDVVARYGAWNQELVAFLAAARGAGTPAN